jgi:hypothetical protein
MQARFLVFLLPLSLLLAGCAGAAQPAATAAPSSEAAPPTVDGSTGSISGKVVDEEQKPLSGAVASIGVMEATSDEAGTFTMNAVEPGDYDLFIGLLGYEQAGKKIQVVPGEILQVQFVLTPVLVLDAYHESFTKKGMVTGQWTVNYVQNFVNVSQVDALLCTCNWIIEFKPGIVDAVTDAYYKPTVTAPGVNEVLIIVYNKALTQGATYAGLAGGDFKPNGDTRHWSEAEVKNLKGVPKARLQLHGPDPDNPGIAFQQTVEIWQTFAWGLPLPDGFTMLAPK